MDSYSKDPISRVLTSWKIYYGFVKKVSLTRFNMESLFTYSLVYLSIGEIVNLIYW